MEEDRGQSPGCLEYQENYCYTVSQTQVQVRRERAGRWGWSWRRTEPRLLRVSGELLLHCQSNANTGTRRGQASRVLGVGGGVEEDKAQAAESIPRITATLSVKRKLVQVHRKGAGRWGDGGGGGQSPGC